MPAPSWIRAAVSGTSARTTSSNDVRRLEALAGRGSSEPLFLWVPTRLWPVRRHAIVAAGPPSSLTQPPCIARHTAIRSLAPGLPHEPVHAAARRRQRLPARRRRARPADARARRGRGPRRQLRDPPAVVRPGAATEVVMNAADFVSRRVLLIDDNEDAAESLAMMLRIEGHEVRTGFSATEAIVLSLSWRPDVVLLDIGLPGMDGYEVARRLRAEPAVAPLRLVALTGYGQPEDIERSVRSGFDAHLVKPVGLEALADAIGRPDMG
ncbi:MAG: response regulator [Burkholderiales bacterium]|nr:response regulator [Burkholderiales bacterium]